MLERQTQSDTRPGAPRRAHLDRSAQPARALAQAFESAARRDARLVESDAVVRNADLQRTPVDLSAYRYVAGARMMQGIGEGFQDDPLNCENRLGRERG